MSNPESSTRDAYGFTIAPAYEQLYAKFTAVWAEEEAERCERWEQWLQSVKYSSWELSKIDDPEFLMERALEQYVSGALTISRTSHAASHLHQLRSLVQMGVPMNRRGQFWKLFLGIKAKRQPGMYEKCLQKALEAELNAQPEEEASISSSILATDNGNGAVAAIDVGPLSLHTEPDIALNGQIPYFTAQNTTTEPSNDTKNCINSTIITTVSPLESSSAVKSNSSRQGPDFGKWGERDWLGQIDKDLHRTFPGHPILDSHGRAMLRRILAAYSARNPSVGYCQGLNFFAAAFMLLVPEEDAFWCLAAIVEDILPGYFDARMIAPQVDALVLTHLLKVHVPSVASHLTRLEVDAASVASGWFLVAFLNSNPFEKFISVWYVLFFERSPIVMFRVSLGLVDIYSQALMETVECSDAYMLLQAMGPMSFDCSRLIDVSSIGYSHVGDGALKILREKYRPQVLERMRSWSIDSTEGELYCEIASMNASLDTNEHCTSPTNINAPIDIEQQQSPTGLSKSMHLAAGNTHDDGNTQEPASSLELDSRSHIDSSLDFKTPVKIQQQQQEEQQSSPLLESTAFTPPPAPTAINQQPYHRQRRTRSAQVMGAHRSSIGRFWQIDVNRLASFVPDFRQPAVAAAYRIAAGPSTQKHPKATSENLQRTPLSLLYAIPRPRVVDQEIGGGVLPSPNSSSGASRSSRVVVDNPIKTLDFGELGNPRYQDQGENGLIHAVPRRFTDGGALLRVVQKKHSIWPEQNNINKKQNDEELSSFEFKALSETITDLETPLSVKSESIVDAIEQRGDALSPGTATEKATRLRHLLTRLQIEVEAARTRAAEAEQHAGQAEELRAALAQQLAKIESEVEEKAATLQNLREKLTEMHHAAADVVAEIRQHRSKIEDLNNQLKSITATLKHYDVLQGLLMQEIAKLQGVGG